MPPHTTACPSDPGKIRLPGPPPADGAIARPAAKSPRRPLKSAFRTYENGQPANGAAEAPDHANWETSEHYRGVRFVVPHTPYRVASDPAGYCWLLQRRRSLRRWESIKFFSNKRRLAVVLKELVSPAAFRTVESKILALPI